MWLPFHDGNSRRSRPKTTKASAVFFTTEKGRTCSVKVQDQLDAIFRSGEMMKLNSQKAMTEGQTPYVAESVVIAARAMRSFATEVWFTRR